MKIEYINQGLGYLLPDGTIQLNKTLLEDLRVHDEILRHELNHNQTKDYSLHDLLHDLKPLSLNAYLFVLIHPSTWIMFSPIRRYKGTTYYDISTIIVLAGNAIITILLLL